jgi:hypothetical protein
MLGRKRYVRRCLAFGRIWKETIACSASCSRRNAGLQSTHCKVHPAIHRSARPVVSRTSIEAPHISPDQLLMEGVSEAPKSRRLRIKRIQACIPSATPERSGSEIALTLMQSQQAGK